MSKIVVIKQRDWLMSLRCVLHLRRRFARPGDADVFRCFLGDPDLETLGAFSELGAAPEFSIFGRVPNHGEWRALVKDLSERSHFSFTSADFRGDIQAGTFVSRERGANTTVRVHIRNKQFDTPFPPSFDAARAFSHILTAIDLPELDLSRPSSLSVSKGAVGSMSTASASTSLDSGSFELHIDCASQDEHLIGKVASALGDSIDLEIVGLYANVGDRYETIDRLCRSGSIVPDRKECGPYYLGFGMAGEKGNNIHPERLYDVAEFLADHHARERAIVLNMLSWIWDDDTDLSGANSFCWTLDRSNRASVTVHIFDPPPSGTGQELKKAAADFLAGEEPEKR
ncbi:MAG: hypothetical protein HYV63_15600 [Candidatus Schekmanbacteria bacterium]|nr:hypothetical protein [Candidatus Schekmanbacteria bacterium]